MIQARAIFHRECTTKKVEMNRKKGEKEGGKGDDDPGPTNLNRSVSVCLWGKPATSMKKERLKVKNWFRGNKMALIVKYENSNVQPWSRRTIASEQEGEPKVRTKALEGERIRLVLKRFHSVLYGANV